MLSSIKRYPGPATSANMAMTKQTEIPKSEPKPQTVNVQHRFTHGLSRYVEREHLRKKTLHSHLVPGVTNIGV